MSSGSAGSPGKTTCFPPLSVAASCAVSTARVAVSGTGGLADPSGLVSHVVSHTNSAPERLRNYLYHLTHCSDPADAAAYLFADDPVTPLPAVEPYASNVGLRFGSKETSAYFAYLFCELADAAGLSLCGWDLYHGHLVAFENHGADDEVCAELGIIFHAREHPREFTNRRGRVLPICSAEMGGRRDPRRDTKLSIYDADFRKRNFLWLLSTNATYLLNTENEQGRKLLSDSVSGKRFFTVNEEIFGKQLGSIFFFPGIFSHGNELENCDPAVPAVAGFRPLNAETAWHDIFCVPFHGFPVDWHVANALRTESWIDELDVVAAKIVAALPDLNEGLLKLLRETENEGPTNENRRKRRRRCGSPDFAASLITAAERELERRREASRIKEEQRFRASHNELVSRGFAREDVEAALKLTGGSAIRSEAGLRVAFARYRSHEESIAAGNGAEIDLATALNVLYDVSPWLAGDPLLALEALRTASEDGITVEMSIRDIEQRQQSKWIEESSERLDKAIAGGGNLEEPCDDGADRRASQRVAQVAAQVATPGATASAGSDLEWLNTEVGEHVGQASELTTQMAKVIDDTAWPTPRCCRTHSLELQMLASESGIGLRPNLQEIEELKKLHAASEGPAWLVLVGGEHGGVMRADVNETRPGPYLAGHCSLQWVGFVYAQLVPYFGRDHIIVVAQLQETLDWLRGASVDEDSAQRMAGRASLLAMLRRRLQETEESCQQLVDDGGADYDGQDVNAATVLNVLTGEKSGGEHCKSRCVPKHGVSSVMLVIVSHGHAHPAGHGSKNHEWYMHFPHPVRPGDDDKYDIVSHQGFRVVDPNPDWQWGAPKYRWRLYSQMLFQAHHTVLERAPRRRLVLFHQFCLSGGAANFMRLKSYQMYCGTSRWPVFAIVTAGLFEAALGNFVGIWTEELVSALGDSGHRSLGDVYAAAEARYWGASPEVQASNAAAARRLCNNISNISAVTEIAVNERDLEADNTEPDTVGTVGREAGFDAVTSGSMDDLPVRSLVNII